MRLATIAAIALTGALTLAGCGQSSKQWSTQNIRGAMPDLAFNLEDENGKPVKADDYHGRVALLFFGYTHCPDVCPATLGILHTALQSLGPKADQIRVLFVSVDPKRDTPKQLSDYTSAFGDNVVGLTGTRAQLDTLTKRYRVTYRYGDPDAKGNYAVYHSAAIFAFDPAGHVQLLMSYSDGLKAIEHDLKQLVGGSA